MPGKGTQRVRHIVFTLNNPEEGDIAKIQSVDIFTYGVIGKEVGESGTPHLQGYLQLAKQTRISSVTKALTKAVGKAPHTEAARGTAKQASDYCKKDGDYVEWGEMNYKGKRNDIKAAVDMIESGASKYEVLKAHTETYVRYSRGLDKAREIFDEHRAEDWREVEVILITGPTGCGKTRTAMADGKPFKIQGDQLQWWDGYGGQKTIVIDEYSNDVKVTQLLGLLDGYKLRLPIKGGFTYAQWTKVYITTNLFELHEQAKEAHREALQRRISKTISYWEHGAVSAMAKTFSAD